MRTTIVLARHGKSEAAAKGLVQGTGLAVPLTVEGRIQAERLADALAGFGFATIVSSPAVRARETAEAVRARFPGVPYAEISELVERSKGESEGMRKADFDSRYPEIVAAWAREEDPRVPGGESFEDVEARAWPVLDRLVREGAGKTHLVVGHGNVFRVLLGRMLGMPHGMRARIGQGYCGISICSYDHDRDRWSVESLNRLP